MARAGSLVDWLGKARRERPVRRMLRKWHALTMLATAGLFVSVAGLMLLVGVGKVQIQAASAAAMSAPSPSLFSDPWVVVGSILGVAGLLWGAAAIASIGSQSKAQREFPAVEIEIVGGGFGPTRLPAAHTTPTTWYSQLIGVRLANRELRRSVSLVKSSVVV